MKPLLIAAVGRRLTAAPLGRREDDVELRRVPALPTASSLDTRRPTVIVLDHSLLATVGTERHRLAELAQVAALVGIGESGESEPSNEFPADLLSSFVPGDATPALLVTQLRGAFRHAASIVAERSARALEQQRYNELTDLTRVGVALSVNRDLLQLLEMILSQARRITSSDAASLYLVERNTDGTPEALRFKLSQNSSLPNLPLSEFTVPIDHASLSGYAAATGESLSIADVYLLPDDVEYKQNRSFDEKFGYRTRSMLVLPMKTHRDEVIGVLQLINRKRDPLVALTTAELVETEVLSYDSRSIELVTALASQAAVAIENSLLYESIERLFEGFVTASVTAIESRDPTTHGHSGRVATLTVGLAEAVDRGVTGPWRGVRFTREQLRELRYAGLLHDFGKVGVREEVLIKQKKLYPDDLALIQHRFAYLRQSAELEFERRRSDYLLRRGREGYDQFAAELEAGLASERAELKHFLDTIVRSNEPTILPEGSFEELARLSERMFIDHLGAERPMLDPAEIRYLTIRKGTLDDSERREIESHVSHTFRFLQQIPWTRELRGIPGIAYGHHEKLNGAGYPRQVSADDIPVQTRMMTISDIFDALTATDRPYKRAVTRDRALDILHMEAKDGMLDKPLLDIFVESRVFDLVLGGDAER